MTPTIDLAVDYPVLNIFWTTCLIFIWIMWLMLLFRVIRDLFRDDSLSGWVKAGWAFFVILFPFIGVFGYLIARGKGMGARDLREAEQSEEAFRSYVRDAAGPSSTAEELARLADLKSDGHISQDEYERAKAKILA